MKQNDHKRVRAWLESEHALDSETETALQAHLDNCADCRAYAEMITQLKAGSWNPFPQQRLTQTESKRLMSQIRPHLKKDNLVQNRGFFRLSSALGLIGLLIIVGLFALAIAQLNQTAVSPTAPLAESDSTLSDYIWYDGWETGVAFQFPASWTINQINAEDNSIITFTTPRNEIGDWFSCDPLAASGASANPAAWFAPFDENMPLSPLESLTFFLESGEISFLETPQAVTIDGRSAAYTLGEIPCEEPANQITAMAAKTATYHVLLVLRHAPADAATTRTELETIITSLTDVDYTGWQPWRPGQFYYTVMAPTGWNVFDAGKSLEVTPNNQPAWSSIADPNQPTNAPRILIYHNLNSQFGDTPQAVVERHIAQMETDLTMQQLDPPTAHPLVPGLVTAVYTTEDTAILFGAITYPRDTVSLDPIGATATVPLDQLDSFRLTFERILRSLNGYYDNIADAPVRAALTSGGAAIPPTASPIAQTTPALNDATSPTPTPIEPSFFATGTFTPPPPIDEGVPTPTPIDFSDFGPTGTSTPFPSTPTPYFTPVPTNTPSPTPYNTPMPTNYPTNSPTPTPYNTPVPTPTPPTPSPTPFPTTFTPTPTPIPPPTSQP